MVILVTGASGSVGRYVVRGLVEAGYPVRAAVTSATGAAPAAGVQAVRFDFADADTYAPALQGVDRVFLMRPPAISDVKRYLRPFIRAMAEARVRQAVFLSVMGVNRVMPHWQIERDLEASGVGHTFVRPAFFTQNLATAYREDIRLRGRIRLPAGSGRTSFIDTRDVAAVAVLALTDPDRHAGNAYTLTGSRGWSYGQVAELLTAELARPVRYERIGFLRYRSELRAQELPADYVRVQLLINALARLGMADKTTDTFRQLTGRVPIALPDSIHYLADQWQQAEPSPRRA